MEVGASTHINIIFKASQPRGRASSSRAYGRHSYNANSGVAIIVGKATRKLLYIEYETSIAQLAHRVFQRRITPVTEIGMHSHHR